MIFLPSMSLSFFQLDLLYRLSISCPMLNEADDEGKVWHSLHRCSDLYLVLSPPNFCVAAFGPYVDLYGKEE